MHFDEGGSANLYFDIIADCYGTNSTLGSNGSSMINTTAPNSIIVGNLGIQDPQNYNR